MKRAQQFTPARQPGGLAFEQTPEHYAVTAQQGHGDVLEGFSALDRSAGAAQQGPAPGIVHAAEKGPASASAAAFHALAGWCDQGTQAGKAVGIDQPGSHQFLQGVLQLGTQQVGFTQQLVKEQGTVLGQCCMDILRAPGQFTHFAWLAQATP
ncbi:hypothetical protein D3C75_864780 [compost metagenome]